MDGKNMKDNPSNDHPANNGALTKCTFLCIAAILVVGLIFCLNYDDRTSAQVQSASGVDGGIQWNLDDNGTLTISPYGTEESGVMKDYDVWEKKAPWMEHKSSFKSLVINNGIKNIGNNAFSGCSGFTGSLTIPNSVTTIGFEAFYGCSGFKGTLTIGDSVSIIKNGAFHNCSGFTGSLTIPDSVTTICFEAFCNCLGFNGLLTLGDSLTTIESGAFHNCCGLTGPLTIPDSMTTICNGAFIGCSGLTGLIIPNSVTKIEAYAFSDCKGFTEMTIPSSVSTIEYGAFNGIKFFDENDNKLSPTVENLSGHVFKGTYEKMVRVVFVNLTFIVNEKGYGTVEPVSLIVVKGSVITTDGNKLYVDGNIVTATPAKDSERYTYEFQRWSVDNGTVVLSDMTITAEFIRKEVGGGSAGTDNTLLFIFIGVIALLILIGAGFFGCNRHH